MYVKVISNVSGDTYRSIVYGSIDVGCYQKYIVLNAKRAKFELVNHISGREPNVFMIQTDTDGFREYDGSSLLKFKYHCFKSGREYPDPSVVIGFPDVCENYELLYELMTKQTADVKLFSVRLRELPDADKWTYINSQEDADAFMKLFVGFHDSTLERIGYIEDDSGTKQATVLFDNSCWYGKAELCFEGVQLMKIVPAGENYSRELFSGSLFADESGVFWADDEMEKPDDSYAYSIIKALSCKWRKID